MTSRTDLLALTPETLVSLANRGLVKRAEKDLAAGAGPEVSADGTTVRGRFPDGTETVLPPGTGLDGSTCTCGAAGVCRHRVGLVLAYRRGAAAGTREEAGGYEDWSPGEFDDGTLAEVLGRPALTAARRTADRGCTVRLHRPTAEDPVPRAELPTCTVRFPVPHELGYALTDAAAPLRGEVVTLAVWAFRASDAHDTEPDRPLPAGGTADGTTPGTGPTPGPPPGTPAEEHPADGTPADGHGTARATPDERTTPEAATGRRGTAGAASGGRAVSGPAVGRPRASDVSLGGRPAPGTGTGAGDKDGRKVLREALGLVDELLLDGVQQAGPVFAGSLSRTRKALTAAALHWPAGAVAELEAQLDAYTARGTRYEPGRLAFLLAELYARQRAAAHDPVAVLGTAEAPETPLRRVRLVALGCRIGGTARDRTAETYFAHPAAGIALVLRRRWELTEEQAPTGHELGTRRLLGSPLGALAASNVVSEHTSRAADRTVSISRGRIAATSVTPVGTAWTELPGALLVHDTAAQLRALTGGPPRLVRPRVEADAVRVVAVDMVESVGYDPAGQLLEAALRDPAGNEVLLRAEYNPLAPGGLDALAEALSADGVSHVSGMLTRAHGRPTLTPLAVLTPVGVVIPDLAPGAGDSHLATAPPRPADPITAALRSGLDALADAAHRGLRQVTPGRLTRSADLLHRTGLTTAATHLRTLTHALASRPAPAAPPAWATAQIHLTTALDLHEQD
ncbi:hypothetical protein AB0F77_00780 [Streptomyces sp. NPDC026672]|uniref:hypothetical protein n=1 Tax=unclassified Streptomyces TaxID=2593676 RepID=UPI0033C9CEBF